MRIAPLLWGMALLAQPKQGAVIVDFSPTVKRVAVGATQCTFWFKSSVPPPYNSEIACYENGKLVSIHVSLPGIEAVESFDFPTGSITWRIIPNKGDPAKIDYAISGHADGDANPVFEIGTL